MRRERQWWWRYDRMNKFFAQLVQCNTYGQLPSVTMVNTVCTCTCAKTCHQMIPHDGDMYTHMMYTCIQGCIQHRKTDLASNQTVMKRYHLKPTGRHRLWPLTYHNTLLTRSGKDHKRWICPTRLRWSLSICVPHCKLRLCACMHWMKCIRMP